MDEQRAWQSSSLEKPSKEQLAAGAIGAAAIALSANWAAKKYLPALKTSAREFLERINVIETDRHSQTIRLFSSLAESFGVTVNESLRTYWRTMLAASRALDNVVDEEQPEDVDQEALALISGHPIDGMSESDAKEFSAILHNASEERREIILNGLQIIDYAKRLQRTTNVSDMLDLRGEEAVIYTSIMTIDNSADDPAIASFNEWLMSLGKTAYHLDSLLDLAKDYREHVTAVKPTPTAYLTVAEQTLQDSYPALKDMPKSALPHLAAFGAQKMARGVLRHYGATNETIE